jgi:hypothetical protein
MKQAREPERGESRREVEKTCGRIVARVGISREEWLRSGEVAKRAENPGR